MHAEANWVEGRILFLWQSLFLRCFVNIELVNNSPYNLFSQEGTEFRRVLLLNYTLTPPLGLDVTSVGAISSLAL